MEIIIKWILFYISIVFAMSIDNVFWVSTSPEYKYFKKLNRFKKRDDYYLELNDKKYYTQFSYIFKYRVWSVLTHPRDIIPAALTSLILTIFWSI